MEPAPASDFLTAARAIGEALLIGLLLGFQREAESDERRPGVRDFILIALTGAVCAILGELVFSVAALLSIGALLTAFHVRTQRTGITTEIAAVAAFCLAYLAASPRYAGGTSVAIATTVVVAFVLAAKSGLHRLIREAITEEEFRDTLQFLAVIFIIYPLLPEGSYGPHGFLAPRKIWLFVILVSSISYIGYFLEKFLGPRKGLPLTAVLGGIASTTAATIWLAREAAAQEDLRPHWQAAIIANAVQFLRVEAVLLAVNQSLAARLAPYLFAAAASGLVLAWLLRHGDQGAAERKEAPVRNPFRLRPALKFGAVFTGILLVAKAAQGEFGGQALLVTSALGGSIDVDAIIVSVADLLSTGNTDAYTALRAVLIAIASNAILKTVLAGVLGRWRFGVRVALGMAGLLLPVAVLLLLESGNG